MPVQPPSSSGVYVQESPDDHHWIRPVDSSTTAFVDFFARGPLDHPLVVDSYQEFVTAYGGLDARSEASYGIRQFFQHGGRRAVVLRVAPAETDRARAATLTLTDGDEPLLTVEAHTPGHWGNELQVGVEVGDSQGRFVLVVRQVARLRGELRVVESEVHDDLSMDQDDPRYAPTTVTNSSALVRLVDHLLEDGGADRPLPELTAATVSDPATLRDPGCPGFRVLTGGSDGGRPSALDLARGMPLLDHADETIGIVCIPAMASLDHGYGSVVGAALAYCRQRRAFLLVDPPLTVTDSADMAAWAGRHGALRDHNAAFYFPPLQVEDPLADGRPRVVAPSGVVAGVCSRLDGEEGVWKAPAGIEARVRGATPVTDVTDADQELLNPIAVNVIRTFPRIGTAVWGARTSVGLDGRVSEWRYVSVRRLALMVEESLMQGLRWAVFEPNDETLWSRIRGDVEVFLHDLFREGAFVGATPREAFFVTCDRTTTTPGDISDGVVNLVVGVAPSKPSEFVVVHLRLRAGLSPR
jgi:uncharacterized protein